MTNDTLMYQTVDDLLDEAASFGDAIDLSCSREEIKGVGLCRQSGDILAPDYTFLAMYWMPGAWRPLAEVAEGKRYTVIAAPDFRTGIADEQNILGSDGLLRRARAMGHKGDFLSLSGDSTEYVLVFKNYD